VQLLRQFHYALQVTPQAYILPSFSASRMVSRTRSSSGKSPLLCGIYSVASVAEKCQETERAAFFILDALQFGQLTDVFARVII
jgi:hypothetical protein